MTMAKLITTPGGEELVLLPRDEYERLVEAAEDMADIAAYDEAKHKLAAGEDELIPSEMVERLFSDESCVRVWREHRGLTVKDLAQAALISPSYLSQIETGRREGTLETMARLARALKVDLDDLVRNP
jgi:ribosome-binding protein aMBF1 (putative translation factor)